MGVIEEIEGGKPGYLHLVLMNFGPFMEGKLVFPINWSFYTFPFNIG